MLNMSENTRKPPGNTGKLPRIAKTRRARGPGGKFQKKTTNLGNTELSTRRRRDVYSLPPNLSPDRDTPPLQNMIVVTDSTVINAGSSELPKAHSRNLPQSPSQSRSTPLHLAGIPAITLE